MKSPTGYVRSRKILWKTMKEEMNMKRCLLYTSRGKARFDLYSAQGAWLCSTRSVLRSEQLSPNWGLLPAAGRAGGLVFSAPEDPASSSAPLLQGAGPLQTRENGPLGYLVVGLRCV